MTSRQPPSSALLLPSAYSPGAAGYTREGGRPGQQASALRSAHAVSDVVSQSSLDIRRGTEPYRRSGPLGCRSASGPRSRAAYHRITRVASGRAPRCVRSLPDGGCGLACARLLQLVSGQGGACGAAGFCEGPPVARRATLTAPADQSGSPGTQTRCSTQPSSSPTIVQLAATLSMAALRAVGCDRLRRPLTGRPLTWFGRLRGERRRKGLRGVRLTLYRVAAEG
jgi:hypothetical protein